MVYCSEVDRDSRGDGTPLSSDFIAVNVVPLISSSSGRARSINLFPAAVMIVELLVLVLGLWLYSRLKFVRQMRVRVLLLETTICDVC